MIVTLSFSMMQELKRNEALRDLYTQKSVHEHATEVL